MTNISGFSALSAFKGWSMLQIPGKAENESYQIDTSDHPLPDQNPARRLKIYLWRGWAGNALNKGHQAQPSETSYWTGRDKWQSVHSVGRPPAPHPRMSSRNAGFQTPFAERSKTKWQRRRKEEEGVGGRGENMVVYSEGGTSENRGEKKVISAII